MRYRFKTIENLEYIFSKYHIIMIYRDENKNCIISKDIKTINKTGRRIESDSVLKLLKEFDNKTRNSNIDNFLEKKPYGEIKVWGHRIFFFNEKHNFILFHYEQKKLNPTTLKVIDNNYKEIKQAYEEQKIRH